MEFFTELTSEKNVLVLRGMPSHCRCKYALRIDLVIVNRYDCR